MITHDFVMDIEDITGLKVQFCFTADDDDLSGLTVLYAGKTVDDRDISLFDALKPGTQAYIREQCEIRVPEALAAEEEYQKEMNHG